jgi:prephenate dehydrogenase
MNRLAIVGFGLIGGSIALGARRAGMFDEVTAIDSPDVLALAEQKRAADAFVERQDREAVERALSRSVLTVLAAPVQVICDSIAWTLAHANAVTDCGSTKRRIVESANRSPRAHRFVPGHPMAGLPHGGLASARADLFEGSTWILGRSGADADSLQLVENLVAALGARVISLDPETHDAAVARTSHLPQLLASALRVLAEQGARAGATGPAFERATRAAGGPEPIWSDIFSSNADEVARSIRELCAELSPIADTLEASGDVTAALKLLERARRIRS